MGGLGGEWSASGRLGLQLGTDVLEAELGVGEKFRSSTGTRSAPGQTRPRRVWPPPPCYAASERRCSS